MLYEYRLCSVRGTYVLAVDLSVSLSTLSVLMEAHNIKERIHDESVMCSESWQSTMLIKACCTHLELQSHTLPRQVYGLSYWQNSA